MEEKRRAIEDYVRNKLKELTSYGIDFSEEQINDEVNKYYTSTDDIESIFKDIDERVAKKIDEYNKMQILENTFLIRPRDNRELSDLFLEYLGITINNQDIDLINIIKAKTKEELQAAINAASNIRINVDDFETDDLNKIKEEVYRIYLDTLEDKNEMFRNRSIILLRKLEYLRSSPELTDTEKNTIIEIVMSSSNNEEIKSKLKSSFSEDRVHKFYEILRECSPIEKSGIKSTSIDATENLISKIDNEFNSITIDEEVKYGSVFLTDNSFDFRRLKKALDFSKRMNKPVRLNGLIFYMDCPEELYSLEKNDQNKQYVKERLLSYVDTTTRYIMDNGYADTVRSIDVFNELLNRFPLSSEVPYKYRGDIEQNPINGVVPDNIKSGWLKHLDIEDLCDVIAVARRNLPNIDFMYNDDNLEDPKKIQATIETIQRIQEYERKNGIKLIDSIGTQMHIDNSVSIDDIENMFRNLSKLGLPIEVTEFDLAMTHKVDGLSDDEIEALRAQKIEEIIRCINNISNECNIRGFTIWSKTDTQNFRVSLENERLIGEGKEPIKTLHGGFFTETMESKAKKLVREDISRPFNYHTHTKRCGHASDNSDRDYIEAARRAGLKSIGFSDHIPFTDIEFLDLQNRMALSLVDEYITSIESLKKENPDIEILSGFEAEYDPAKKEFLSMMREKVDYMILGQHFVRDGLEKISRSNNPNYPLQYAKSVCEALDSGIFDMVAHPDIFMSFIATIDSFDEREVFYKNALEASRMICQKAKDLDIPLELNLGGLDSTAGYPFPAFWEIASEVGVKTIIGADAHNPMKIESMKEDQEKLKDRLGNIDLNIVDMDYNPKKARENNIRLHTAFLKTKSESMSYGTYLSLQIVSKIIDSLKDVSDIKEISSLVVEKIDQIAKDQDLESQLESISNNQNISNQEKAEKLADIKEKMQDPNFIEVLSKRQKILQKLSETVSESIFVGCQTKEDILSHVKNHMEGKKQETKDNSELNKMISTPVQQPGKEEIKQQSPPKVLTKSNNQNNNSRGFVGTISLITTALIVVGTILIMIISLLNI